jgi:hypothetical protein
MYDRNHPALRSIRRSVVARQITCPRTGEVLDIRTAVFVNDKDGFPEAVVSPTGAEEIRADQPTIDALASRGLTLETQEV